MSAPITRPASAVAAVTDRGTVLDDQVKCRNCGGSLRRGRYGRAFCRLRCAREWLRHRGGPGQLLGARFKRGLRGDAERCPRCGGRLRREPGLLVCPLGCGATYPVLGASIEAQIEWERAGGLSRRVS